jgi:hypothetical protein
VDLPLASNFVPAASGSLSVRAASDASGNKSRNTRSVIDSRKNAFAKINRPSPACSSNQTFADSRIPLDSGRSENALGHTRPAAGLLRRPNRTRSGRLIFIESTNVARLHGRAPKGERLRAGIPQGHWKTTTFVAGLRLTGLMTPMVCRCWCPNSAPRHHREHRLWIAAVLAAVFAGLSAIGAWVPIFSK